MDLNYQEALKNVGRAVETIKSRTGVEKVNLIHQNGINIKASPTSLEDQSDIVILSSRIFLLTNQVHNYDWEYIILECRYGNINIVPLFFDQSRENCPFFLQIITQPNYNSNDLLLNIQNSIGTIINSIESIENELHENESQIPLDSDDELNIGGENPNISSILYNYFGSESSLDISTVIAYIDGETLNIIDSDTLRSDIIREVKLPKFRSIVSYSNDLVQRVKQTRILSVRVVLNTKFHFIFPLETRDDDDRMDFLSVTTKNQSRMGFWYILLPQITKKISNLYR